MSAHPMTDGPSMERFERDLKEYAKEHPKEHPTPPMLGFDLNVLAAQQQNRAASMVGGASNALQPPKAAPVPDSWTCPKCGAAGNTGRFCPECGGKKPE